MLPHPTTNKSRKPRFSDHPLYQLTLYRHNMGLQDGIYSGRYEGEHAIIRIKEDKPVFVQWVGGHTVITPEMMKSSLQLLIPNS